MEKLRFILLLFCIYLICLSCKKRISYHESVFKKLNVKYLDKIKLSVLIDDEIDYLLLESDSSNLIGEVKRIIFADSIIYVLDSRISKRIFRFDLDGNFMNSFGQVGAGPGEYGVPTDMAIVGNKILVVDGSNFSKLTFDLDGRFETEERTWMFVQELIPDGNKLVLYSPTNFLPDGNKEEYGTDVIKVISTDFSKIYASFLPYEENHDDAGLDGMLSYYNNNVTYARPLRGEFFNITDANKIEPTFKIDFGKYNWPISMEEITKNQEKAEEIFSSHDVMSLIHRICETKNYLIFQTYLSEARNLNDAESDKWLMIHKKGTDVCYAINKIVNDVDGGVFSFPILSYNETLVSVIGPEELLSIQHDNTDIINSAKAEYLENLTRNLSIKDNPILMKYRLKDNLSFFK